MLSRGTYGRLAGVFFLTLNFHAFAAAPVACDLKRDFSVPEWRTDCDAAIAQEKEPQDRAELLHHRAYVAIEQYRHEDALADLNAAVTADPKCANCLHERAYLNSELGEYAAAIADLDHEIALRPEFAGAYRERAFARTYNGDLEGAYQDRASGHGSPSAVARRLARVRYSCAMAVWALISCSGSDPTDGIASIAAICSCVR